MAQTLKPGTTAGEELSEAVFADSGVHISGVFDDSSGDGLKVTSDGSSTTVSVAAGKALAKGLVYESTAPEAVTLGSLGTQPTAGQERYSLVVVRLSTAGAYSATITARTGSPAATGSASIPVPLRDASTWEVPLALVRQSGTLAVTQGNITDRREHVSTHAEVTAASPIEGPIGSTRGRGSVLYRITPTGLVAHDAANQTGLYVDGQVSGVNATANSANSWITQAAFKSGVVLSATRRYQLTFSGSVTTTASGGSGFDLSFISTLR